MRASAFAGSTGVLLSTCTSRARDEGARRGGEDMTGQEVLVLLVLCCV